MYFANVFYWPVVWQMAPNFLVWSCFPIVKIQQAWGSQGSNESAVMGPKSWLKDSVEDIVEQSGLRFRFREALTACMVFDTLATVRFCSNEWWHNWIASLTLYNELWSHICRSSDQCWPGWPKEYQPNFGLHFGSLIFWVLTSLHAYFWFLMLFALASLYQLQRWGRIPHHSPRTSRRCWRSTCTNHRDAP